MGDDKSEIDCFPPSSPPPPKHTQKKERKRSLHPISPSPLLSISSYFHFTFIGLSNSADCMVDMERFAKLRDRALANRGVRVRLSMGNGSDRSELSTHVDRSEILTCP